MAPHCLATGPGSAYPGCMRGGYLLTAMLLGIALWVLAAGLATYVVVKAPGWLGSLMSN